MKFPIPIVVVDTEPNARPMDKEGQVDTLEVSAVYIGRSGTIEDEFSSTPGGNTALDFSNWLREHRFPPVTAYNLEWEKKRLAEVGIGGLEWGPCIMQAYIPLMPADKQVTLPNGFKKWPTLEEAMDEFGVSQDGDFHKSQNDARGAAELVILYNGSQE